jgi:hypothetical protein
MDGRNIVELSIFKVMVLGQLAQRGSTLETAVLPNGGQQATD